MFTCEAKGERILPTLVLPLKEGQGVPVTSVSMAEDNGALCFSIVFDDDRVHSLRVPVESPPAGTTGALHWTETIHGRVRAEIGVAN